MSCYNRMKAADRRQERADLADELDALRAGKWPRSSSEALRWQNPEPEHVRACLEQGIAYLDDLDRRILAGDTFLTGWEPPTHTPTTASITTGA